MSPQELLRGGASALIHGPGVETPAMLARLGAGAALVLEHDPQGQALRARLQGPGPIPVLLAREPGPRALRLLEAALLGALGRSAARVERLGARATPQILALCPAAAPPAALLRLFSLRLPAAQVMEAGRARQR